jgi:type II secretory pathway pseudopilin PulG
VSLLLVAVVLILVIGAIIAFVALFGRTRVAGNSLETTSHLAAVQAALEQYAATSGNLPCPANPALDTGDADPVNASATCNSPAGTVPWRTIGLPRDEAYDASGWKISYRVYTGPTGLTQVNGASMVLCTTDPAGTSPGVGAGGVCQVDANGNHTKDSEFLAGKGLQVTDFATVHSDAAYVLVSHGPSGMGAYTSAGVRKSLPNNADELSNTNAAGPFVVEAASSVDIAPDAATHFDDVLAYRSLPDFMVHANLAARLWPATPLVGYTMTSATIATALGRGSVSAGDLGNNSITFGSSTDRARVRGFENGSNVDLALDTTGGAESLGVAGSGGITFLSSARNDKIRIDFNQDVNQLGVALADFGTATVGATTNVEQAQFVFSRGTSGAPPVTVVKQGCRADNGLATFSINPGIDFERVEITPLNASPTGTTQFGVADFQACGPGGTCLSALASAAVACP